MYFTRYTIMAIMATSLFAQIPVQTFVLPSGLTCKLIEDHKKPLIRIELVNRWGSNELGLGKAELGGLLAEIISGMNANECTNKKPDMRYGELTFKAEVGSYYWNFTTDSYCCETSIGLLADAVIRPKINKTILEIQRQNLLTKYKFASPRSLAMGRFLRDIECPEEVLPTELTLKKVSYQNVFAFKQLVIRPETSTIAIYGDLNFAQATQLVFLHFGTWGSSKKLESLQFTNDDAYVHSSKITAISEIESGVELWAGAPCPSSDIAQATRILLPIALNQTVKSFSNDFQMVVSLSENLQSLFIKTQIPKIDRDRRIIEFISSLDKLQKNQISSEDLRRALIQWKSENNALALHPAKLLHQAAIDRIDSAFLRSVELVTVDDINQAIKLWLNPERIRMLLLGANIPSKESMEKLGLTVWAN